MNSTGNKSKKINFEMRSPAVGVLAVGVALCGVSLALIAQRLEPISEQSKLWNGCVETTWNFLASLPSYAVTNSKDLKAMSVNLCNGSTPQQAKPST